MTDSMLKTAAELLRQHYGVPSGPGELYRWTTLVRVVTSRARPERREAVDAEWIENGSLRTARETVQTESAGLAELLKSRGNAPRLAGTVRGLARWWLESEEREQESADAWNRPVERLRDELRSLPGVSLTLADCILLLVGGLSAFPVDRATIRIAGRHGWLEPTAEYDEWQAYFTRGTDDSANSLANLHQWFGRTGRDYCGVQARCDGCPVRPLLPVSGPVPLSDEEGD